MGRIFSRRGVSSAFRQPMTGRRAGALVVAAALLASVVGVEGSAQAVPTASSKAAAASASGVCGTAVSANSDRTAARAAAAEVKPFDIAKWFGEKAGGAIAGKVAGMGFEYVSNLIGLGRILPESEGAKTLAELAKIEDQLASVSARLDLIGAKIDQAITELRGVSLNLALDKACGYVNETETVYQHYYIPVLQAGMTLGGILTSNHPEYADVRIGDLPPDVQKLYTTSSAPCGGQGLQITCFTPKTLVSERLKNFKTAVEDHHVIATARQLSNLLRPHELTTSVLTAYGKYLMTKRYLTRADSESLVGIYNDLAQGEALAAWMEAEYYTYYNVNESSEHVFKAYEADRQAEHDGLPPMIPEGAVIDLEQKNADSTRHRPIWMLASAQDTTYWPIGVESNNDVTTTADGAAAALAPLNSKSCAADAVCITQWRIPTTLDLKSLMSDNCKVDTTKNPPQLPSTCKPLVNAAAGSPDVAKYLSGLNPTDSTWTEVFCDRAAVKCPAPPGQHNFIWTTDRRSHTTDCGFTVPLYTVVYSRRYSLRVGLPLNFRDLNSVWPIYPLMPGKIPDYSRVDANTSHAKCDAYTRTQIAAPGNKGIVLATADTGTVDFMAQPGSAAAQAPSKLTAPPKFTG